MEQAERQLLTQLKIFKRAAAQLSFAWGACECPNPIANYPDYLPSFDQFVADVQAMEVTEHDPLPELPAVGTIVRARNDLDCSGYARWPKGWTGELVAFDGEYVHVQAHRYIAALAEWDNCRVIGLDHGITLYEQGYGERPSHEVMSANLVALALLDEFEVC